MVTVILTESQSCSDNMNIVGFTVHQESIVVRVSNFMSIVRSKFNCAGKERRRNSSLHSHVVRLEPVLISLLQVLHIPIRYL